MAVSVSGVREYAARFDTSVRSFLPEVAHQVPAIQQRLHVAGVLPEELDSVAALDRIPVLGKDELCDLQANQPPFGGYLAGGAKPRRVFQSPGPIYEPQFDTPDPSRWAPALRAAGFSAGDVVLNTFGYHLTPAGAMFEEACRAIGCTVVPAGVGGESAQVRLCADLGVTAYVGTPSYLKVILETADEVGVDVGRLSRAFVSAEPLPGSLRRWLRARVPTVHQGYGTAEAGNLGYECAEMNGLHVPTDALVQICDLTTGEARYDDAEGQVVATMLSPLYPLVRFGTGDLSSWAPGECGCDIATPRLSGWLGRVGSAVKVRGLFVHPRQLVALMSAIPQVADYRFVIDRVDHRDTLRCELVATGGTDRGAVLTLVRARARSLLRLAVDVVLVDAVENGGPLVDRRTWS